MEIKRDMDALRDDEKTNLDVIMKSVEEPPKVPLCDRDIWDLTSPELICLAAKNPRAVIRHLQDIGKELNLKIAAPPRTGELQFYICPTVCRADTEMTDLILIEPVPVPILTRTGKHILVTGECVFV